MKTIRLLFVLAFSIAATRAAEKEVKLLGVTSGLGIDLAVIKVGGNSPEWLRVAALKTGQSLEDVEMGNIDAAKGTATVKVSGKERQLSMPLDSNDSSTNGLDPSLPVIYFHGLSLEDAMWLYADYRKRTGLVHPQLGEPTFSLKVNPRNKTEALEAWEKLFHEHGIATIPDGEHFVMVVPFAFTNSVTARSSTLPQTNSLIPAMSINFHNTPIALVLETYSDFKHEELVNLQDNSWLKAHGPYPIVTLVQRTPLSREEICYALETLIEWNDIRMVPDRAGKLKLERISNR